MELCQASFACWNFNVVRRFGPVAQESLVDSALLKSLSGPSKTPPCTQVIHKSLAGDPPQISA